MTSWHFRWVHKNTLVFFNKLRAFVVLPHEFSVHKCARDLPDMITLSKINNLTISWSTGVIRSLKVREYPWLQKIEQLDPYSSPKLQEVTPSIGLSRIKGHLLTKELIRILKHRLNPICVTYFRILDTRFWWDHSTCHFHRNLSLLSRCSPR